MQRSQDRNWVAGAVLVVVGALLLAGQWFDITGAFVLGALAVLFLGLWAATRTYGFLIPGFILGGLALGVGLEGNGMSLHGGVVVLGLALGFLAIFVANVALDRGPQWWPLIPATILGVVGTSTAFDGTELERVGGVLWPTLLIAAGLAVLLTNLRMAGRGT